MIYIVTRHDHAFTVEDLARRTAEHGAADVRLLTYGDLFFERVAPVGHYVFTDFDRLSAYEIEVAETLARHIKEAAPDAKILNRPVATLERYPLLRKLARLGLNDFSAVRLDAGDLPETYPVFIRLEDDCLQPDSPLIHSEPELLAAIEALEHAGKTIKRRIAVEFCAEADSDGLHRKYGVFRIGEHLIPQHLMHNADWYVKRATNQRVENGPDPHEEEKVRFLRDFPHGEAVMERFRLANIEFGRIDYGFVRGRMQTYEINTNPTFPPLWSDDPNDPRAERRALFRSRILAALTALDTPVKGPETIRFKLPRPRQQIFGPVRKQPKDKVPPARDAEASGDATP